VCPVVRLRLRFAGCPAVDRRPGRQAARRTEAGVGAADGSSLIVPRAGPAAGVVDPDAVSDTSRPPGGPQLAWRWRLPSCRSTRRAGVSRDSPAARPVSPPAASWPGADRARDGAGYRRACAWSWSGVGRRYRDGGTSRLEVARRRTVGTRSGGEGPRASPGSGWPGSSPSSTAVAAQTPANRLTIAGTHPADRIPAVAHPGSCVHRWTLPCGQHPERKPDQSGPPHPNS